jgi:biotin carboxylase
VKLLGVEADQVNTYFHSRYQQVVDRGADLFILNGVGVEDYWQADRFRLAGSKQIDDLISAARDWHRTEGFDGVFTFSESAVVAVAAIGEALGLPSVGTSAAVLSRNKIWMREAHAKAGVPHPEFAFTPDLDTALGAAERIGYPLILKPTLGSGSNFVFRADNPAELRDHFAQAADGIDRMVWYRMEADGIDLGPHGLMIESFLDGHEHLIEALAWDDDVYLGSIVDRVTVEGATFDDDVHHAPTALSATDLAAMHDVVAAATRAQGIIRGVLHAEIRFHDGRPYPVEIAIRPGGGGLDHIARLSAGYDPIQAVIDVAVGTRPQAEHYRPTEVHTAAMCLISDAGELDAVDIPASVSESDRVFFLKLTAKPGDVIRRPPDGNTILGFLGTTGDSFTDAMGVATDLAARIEVRMRDDKARLGGAIPLASIPSTR